MPQPIDQVETATSPVPPPVASIKRHHHEHQHAVTDEWDTNDPIKPRKWVLYEPEATTAETSIATPIPEAAPASPITATATATRATTEQKAITPTQTLQASFASMASMAGYPCHGFSPLQRRSGSFARMNRIPMETEETQPFSSFTSRSRKKSMPLLSSMRTGGSQSSAQHQHQSQTSSSSSTMKRKNHTRRHSLANDELEAAISTSRYHSSSTSSPGWNSRWPMYRIDQKQMDQKEAARKEGQVDVSPEQLVHFEHCFDDGWVRGQPAQIRWRVLDHSVVTVRIDVCNVAWDVPTTIGDAVPNSGVFEWRRVYWGMPIEQGYYVRMYEVRSDGGFRLVGTSERFAVVK